MLQKHNISRVLKIFFENPTKKFQLRELSRISKISTTGVKSSLLEILNAGLIVKTRENNYEYYESNKDSPTYKIHRKFFIVKLFNEIGLLGHLEKEFNHPEAMFLFGSAARGEDVERSDIDIFVLSSHKEVDLSKYNLQLKREIKLLVMNKEEFERAKKKNPELINNIVNGINLSGFLEVL